MYSSGMHERDADTVLKEMKSGRSGLSDSEAQKRFSKYGPNTIKREKKISRAAIFLSQFRNILVIILIIAALVSAIVLNSVLDSAVIMIIVVLNGIFGYMQEYRAEKTIEALRKMTTPEAIVMRDGRKKKITSDLIVPGDIVLLEEGSRIPADMRLTETVNLKIDESALTGESVPVTKLNAVTRNAPLSERKGMSYMGTLVTYGRGTGVVTATGMNTEIGKIAHLIEEAEDEPTPLQKRLGVFGKNLAIIILAISFFVMIIIFFRSGVLAGGDVERAAMDSFLLGIALAIAAIPEGLPAVVTITMALGLQRLSKRNALVRKLPAVETLGSTSVICSDKTGTLTMNEMMVRRVYCDSRLFEVTGSGYSTKGEFLSDGGAVNPRGIKALALLLRTGALCNNASLGENDTIVGDPTEGAILVAAAKGLDVEGLGKRYPRRGEFPFSSERKRMSTINDVEGGLESCVKGAPELVLDRCTHVYKNGRISVLSNEEKEMILSVNHNLSMDALRVLGFAFRKVRSPDDEDMAETGLVFLGLMGMIDPPRTEVKDLIKSCSRAGIRVIMITGDHKNTATAIAKELGIFRSGDSVLTGQDIDSVDDKRLAGLAERVSVYARVNPLHKVRILEALREKHIVAMTGDGVNDAPALKKADIGIAMGIKGTDVAKEASDMILQDDNFRTIVSAVEEGRAIYDNIKKFIQYLLSSNLGEVMIIFFALLLLQDPSNPAVVVIPVTAIQLLWINLLTDGLPALALGVDPPAKKIMDRPPRDPDERILSRSVLSDIIIVGSIITVGTLFIFALNLPSGILLARTAAFTTIVMFEMVRVQTVRMRYGLGILSNKKLVLAVAASVALQLLVIYVPLLQGVFGTVPLGIEEWSEIILLSAAVAAIVWMKEWLGRLVKRRAQRT